MATVTMRQSGSAAVGDIPLPLPVTYTPATHRISKAKKGKRVHACQYPGCNKVFTRAEHRRRHEVNHNPDAWYRCDYPGCKKSFRRRDLFSRHTEKHESESQKENDAGQGNPQHQNSLDPPEDNGPSECVPADPNAEQFLRSTSPTSTSMGATTDIQRDLANGCPSIWNHAMDIPMQQPRPFVFQNHVQDESASPFYSPPETCPSPSSDGTTIEPSPVPRSSVLSAPAITGIEQNPQFMLKPAPPLDMGCWTFCGGALLESNSIPVALTGAAAQSALQYQYPSFPWAESGSPVYDESQFPPPRVYHAPMGWEQWIP